MREEIHVVMKILTVTPPKNVSNTVRLLYEIEVCNLAIVIIVKWTMS